MCTKPLWSSAPHRGIHWPPASRVACGTSLYPVRVHRGAGQYVPVHEPDQQQQHNTWTTASWLCALLAASAHMRGWRHGVQQLANYSLRSKLVVFHLSKSGCIYTYNMSKYIHFLANERQLI